MSGRHISRRRVPPAGDGDNPMRRRGWLPLVILWLGIAVTGLPLYVAFVASTLTPQQIAQAPMPLLPGGQLWDNYRHVLLTGGTSLVQATPVWRMLVNSAVLAVAVAVGKIAISLLSAFAVAFFAFPGRMLCFWLIFATLMLPVEVRILPTYEVVARLGLIDSHAGLILPLLASATATLLFRQVFMTIPDELVEAARIDGAGPLRFLWDVVVPLSRTNMAALFVIMFLYGWNQYLWPLLVTTSGSMDTVVIGITRMIGTGAAVTDWHYAMATAMLALLPPVAVVLLMQRWFVKGLVDSEK